MSDEPTTSSASAARTRANAASTRGRGHAFAEEHDARLDQAATTGAGRHLVAIEGKVFEIGIAVRSRARIQPAPVRVVAP